MQVRKYESSLKILNSDTPLAAREMLYELLEHPIVHKVCCCIPSAGLCRALVRDALRSRSTLASSHSEVTITSRSSTTRSIQLRADRCWD